MVELLLFGLLYQCCLPMDIKEKKLNTCPSFRSNVVGNSIQFCLLVNKKKDIPADTTATWDQREYERASENEVMRLELININMTRNRV